MSRVEDSDQADRSEVGYRHMTDAADAIDDRSSRAMPPFDGTELDFWLGEWSATWQGGHGTNRVIRDFDGKVIHEEFHAEPDPDGSGALRGESWSVFSPRRAL